MAMSRKKYEERYAELVRRQTKLMRGMRPQSIAERMYPKLKTDDERRREEKLKSHQKR